MAGVARARAEAAPRRHADVDRLRQLPHAHDRPDRGARVDALNNDGIGHSYGAEFLLQARRDKFFGWVSYTYSHSDRVDHPGAMTPAVRHRPDAQPDRARELEVRRPRPVAARRPVPVHVGHALHAGDGCDLRERSQLLPGRVRPAQLAAQCPAAPARPPARSHVPVPRLEAVGLPRHLERVHERARRQLQYNANYTERKQVTGIPILPALGLRGEF